MFTWSCFNYFWLFWEIMLQIIITIIANVINFKHLELGFYMSQDQNENIFGMHWAKSL